MYKTVIYEDIISNQDNETQKQFELIRNLSENFSVKNPVALELDEELFFVLEKKSKHDSGDQMQKQIKRKPDSNSDIEEAFHELFESVRKGINISAPTSFQMEQAINEALSRVKIKESDLDDSIREKLSSKAQVIRYEIEEKKLPDFEKPPISEFQQMVDDLVLGNNLFLIGGAGTGKTFTAENLLTKLALGREHITINCSQWTAPTEIIGGQTMDGYQEGKLIEAWTTGKVLILDELPKIDPNTAGLFNDALAKTKLKKAIIFNSRKESFVKHADFACIATGNIYPDKESNSYGANNKQDLSLLDRFSGSVYFIEKNPVIEKEIVQNNMIWSICDKLRSAIEELKYEAQLSLRFMQTARDSFNLEMKRMKDKKGGNPNDGKTFKSTVESFLSTFSSIQQKNLKDKIRFDEIFSGYKYRQLPANELYF